MCETDAAVPLLLEAVTPRPGSVNLLSPTPVPPVQNTISLRSLASALEAATLGVEVCYTRLPLGWDGSYIDWRHPLDYIGHDGGAGIGSGPGITVGAGLALKGTGRIPIALMGDGDFLMGNTAIWTAAHYRIPALIIVCNNRSFFNDERHQKRVAAWRGRPLENCWIGQRLDDPDIDIASMARAQGAVGVGPVTEAASLRAAIEEGISAAQGGLVCVIDVRMPRAYDIEDV
jgi:thiamine pyrophosphate-dependent acetolactate synthase large subunit-like protein